MDVCVCGEGGMHACLPLFVMCQKRLPQYALRAWLSQGYLERSTNWQHEISSLSTLPLHHSPVDRQVSTVGELVTALSGLCGMDSSTATFFHASNHNGTELASQAALGHKTCHRHVHSLRCAVWH